jgi:hypothetical protein
MINTARKRKGQFTKTVRVTTNDANNANPSLICEGSVKVPFEMEPATISFAEIQRNGEGQHKTVKITRGEGGPLAPELAPVENKNVRAELREIEPGEAYELDVELVPPWPNQAIQTYLQLKTGIEQVPEERIRVYARVAPRLRSIPTRFTIPRDIKSDLDLKARLVWSGENPGKVLEVRSSDPKLTASLNEENGEPVVVLHVPQDYAISPQSRDFVTVTTDDDEAPLLRIQTYVARAAPPGQAGQPTATPGKPTLRRIEGPPIPAGKPITAGARPTIRRTKPAGESTEPTAGPPAPPTKPADQPAKPEDKPAKPADTPTEKPD